jgi:hypothetical protein
MPEGTSGNVAVYAHISEDPTAADTMVHVAENASFTVPPLPQRGSSQSLDESLTRIKSALSETVFTVPPPAPYCYWVAAMACLNSCNLGYDVGSVGGAALLMQEEFGWSSGQLSFYIGMLVDEFESYLSLCLLWYFIEEASFFSVTHPTLRHPLSLFPPGSMNFFCIAGALNAGYVCDMFGRRRTFTISCAIFIVGILIQVRSRGREGGKVGERRRSRCLFQVVCTREDVDT